MNSPSSFEHILASLHDTVLDDSKWPATSALIDEAFGSKGNFLVSGDGEARDDVEIFFAWFCFRGQRRPELERLYFEVYHAVDERLPRVRRLPDAQVVHISSLYIESEMETSVVYNEALPLSDTSDSLNVRLDGPYGSRIYWVVADSVDGDGWSSAQVETIERLSPHLRQFVHVRDALINARALGSSVAALLENTRCGIIHLDLRGRVVAANDRARELLRNDDALAYRDGHLHASTPAEDTRLQALLAGALPRFGEQGVSGTMTLRRSAHSGRLALHATPVSEGLVEARPSRVAALLLVVDPAGYTSIDADHVSAVLDLTPAEGRVAVMLAQGNTVRDTAVATGRSATTIRWHLQQIFAKLGISRQAELVGLVLSVADLPRGRC